MTSPSIARPTCSARLASAAACLYASQLSVSHTPAWFGGVGGHSLAVSSVCAGGESGSADTVRDPRGFAVKFYTDDGNWDLVGNNTPIFFIRDPMHVSRHHSVRPLQRFNVLYPAPSSSPTSSIPRRGTQSPISRCVLPSYVRVLTLAIYAHGKGHQSSGLKLIEHS